ncbi:hypothetical protein E2C01_094197 [Portunus trituberculatus]|uniref:Uncharacterized protein n=1 Tax=Portunus trituberculatus TaxID=210409 RepID=A0A5B7K2G2_PORTR|nr:hypothetical protein [Portunus trituberculatus]
MEARMARMGVRAGMAGSPIFLIIRRNQFSQEVKMKQAPRRHPDCSVAAGVILETCSPALPNKCTT